MINLTKLKVFDPRNMPEAIEPYDVLSHEEIKTASEKIEDLPPGKDSDWIANDKFINIIWRMIATCLRDNRISLSAPQIGIFKQFFVMRFFDLVGEGIRPLDTTISNSSFIVLINPSWSHNNKNEAKVSAYESYFHSPDENILIERPYSVIAEYITLNYNNNDYNIIEELNGWKARVFLRELDHLHGKILLSYKK